MNYESDHIQSIPKPQPFIGSLTGEVKELRERLDRGRHQLNNVDRRLAILESDADDDVEYMDKFPDLESIVTKEQLQRTSSWIQARINAVSGYANARIDVHRVCLADLEKRVEGFAPRPLLPLPEPPPYWAWNSLTGDERGG